MKKILIGSLALAISMSLPAQPPKSRPAGATVKTRAKPTVGVPPVTTATEPPPAPTKAMDSGAFGLRSGMRLSEMKIVRTMARNVYEVKVPKPHPEFATYWAVVSESSGLCKVLGIGIAHGDDRYGTETKSAFSGLKAALNGKYGPSSDYDYLKSGALWKRDQDWTMSLKQNERRLVSYWSKERGGASWPESLVGIILEAKAATYGETQVNLSYEFTTMPSCSGEANAKDNEGL